MRFFFVAIIVVIFSLQLACKSAHSDPAPADDSGLTHQELPAQAEQFALAGIESSAGSSEGTPPAPPLTGLVATLPHLSGVRLVTDCTSVGFSQCSNGASTLNWNACTLSDGQTVAQVLGSISGLFTMTAGGASDNNACTSVVFNQGSLPTGDTLKLVANMTLDLISIPDPGAAYNGMKVIEDFHPGTAWDGTTFPNASSGYVVSNNGGTRTIQFEGKHDGLVAPHGTVWINYASSGNLTVTGTLAAGTRALQDGLVVTSWHNILKYKAVHSVNGIAWTDPNCCHPTHGQLTSVVTGSVNRTGTLTFTNNACGQPSYDDGQGHVTTVTLSSGC